MAKIRLRANRVGRPRAADGVGITTMEDKMEAKDIAVNRTVFVKRTGDGSRSPRARRERSIGTVMATGWDRRFRLRGDDSDWVVLPDGHRFRHPRVSRSGGALILVRVDRHVSRHAKQGSAFDPLDQPSYEACIEQRRVLTHRCFRSSTKDPGALVLLRITHAGAGGRISPDGVPTLTRLVSRFSAASRS